MQFPCLLQCESFSLWQSGVLFECGLCEHEGYKVDLTLHCNVVSTFILYLALM